MDDSLRLFKDIEDDDEILFNFETKEEKRSSSKGDKALLTPPMVTPSGYTRNTHYTSPPPTISTCQSSDFEYQRQANVGDGYSSMGNGGNNVVLHQHGQQSGLGAACEQPSGYPPQLFPNCVSSGASVPSSYYPACASSTPFTSSNTQYEGNHANQFPTGQTHMSTAYSNTSMVSQRFQPSFGSSANRVRLGFPNPSSDGIATADDNNTVIPNITQQHAATYDQQQIIQVSNVHSSCISAPQMMVTSGGEGNMVGLNMGSGNPAGQWVMNGNPNPLLGSGNQSAAVPSNLPLQIVNGQLVMQAQCQRIQTPNGVVLVLRPMQLQQAAAPQTSMASGVPTPTAPSHIRPQTPSSPMVLGFPTTATGSNQTQAMQPANVTGTMQSSNAKGAKARPIKPRPTKKSQTVTRRLVNAQVVTTPTPPPQADPQQGKLSIQLDPENATKLIRLNDQIEAIQNRGCVNDPTLQNTLLLLQKERDGILDSALMKQHGISASNVGGGAPIVQGQAPSGLVQPQIVNMNGQSYMMVPSGAQPLQQMQNNLMSQGQYQYSGLTNSSPQQISMVNQQLPVGLDMGGKVDGTASQTLSRVDHFHANTSLTSNQHTSLQPPNILPSPTDRVSGLEYNSTGFTNSQQVISGSSLYSNNPPSLIPEVDPQEQLARAERRKELATRRKAEIFKRYKEADERVVETSELERSFRDQGDVIARLMPYHLNYEPDFTSQFMDTLDDDLTKVNDILKRRKNALERRFLATKLKTSAVTNPVGEQCLLSNLLYWHEKDLLEAEKRTSETNPEHWRQELARLSNTSLSPTTSTHSQGKVDTENSSVDEKHQREDLEMKGEHPVHQKEEEEGPTPSSSFSPHSSHRNGEGKSDTKEEDDSPIPNSESSESTAEGEAVHSFNTVHESNNHSLALPPLKIRVKLKRNYEESDSKIQDPDKRSYFTCLPSEYREDSEKHRHRHKKKRDKKEKRRAKRKHREMIGGENSLPVFIPKLKIKLGSISLESSLPSTSNDSEAANSRSKSTNDKLKRSSLAQPNSSSAYSLGLEPSDSEDDSGPSGKQMPRLPPPNEGLEVEADEDDDFSDEFPSSPLQFAAKPKTLNSHSHSSAKSQKNNTNSKNGKLTLKLSKTSTSTGYESTQSGSTREALEEAVTAVEPSEGSSSKGMFSPKGERRRADSNSDCDEVDKEEVPLLERPCFSPTGSEESDGAEREAERRRNLIESAMNRLQCSERIEEALKGLEEMNTNESFWSKNKRSKGTWIGGRFYTDSTEQNCMEPVPTYNSACTLPPLYKATSNWKDGLIQYPTKPEENGVPRLLLEGEEGPGEEQETLLSDTDESSGPEDAEASAAVRGIL